MLNFEKKDILTMTNPEHTITIKECTASMSNELVANMPTVMKEAFNVKGDHKPSIVRYYEAYVEGGELVNTSANKDDLVSHFKVNGYITEGEIPYTQYFFDYLENWELHLSVIFVETKDTRILEKASDMIHLTELKNAKDYEGCLKMYNNFSALIAYMKSTAPSEDLLNTATMMLMPLELVLASAVSELEFTKDLSEEQVNEANKKIFTGLFGDDGKHTHDEFKDAMNKERASRGLDELSDAKGIHILENPTKEDIIGIINEQFDKVFKDDKKTNN